MYYNSKGFTKYSIMLHKSYEWKTKHYQTQCWVRKYSHA